MISFTCFLINLCLLAHAVAIDAPTGFLIFHVICVVVNGCIFFGREA